jgi:isopentenyl-diphosphate delta-isomerase
MEVVDRVDVNDNIIGQTTKEEAHKNGYIHRAAVVFCFNSEGKLLVQYRKKDGLLDCSVGGHVGQGEAYEAAAEREMKEELGIVKGLKKVGIFYGDEITFRNQTIDHFFGFFEADLTVEDVKNINIEPKEVEKITPMSLEEIAKDMAKSPEKYTCGFMRTVNFYIEKNSLPIPLVEVK